MDVLRDAATRLAVPGLPEWTGLLALLLLLLVGLAFLLMPFAVFGLKGRLEAIEAQLDSLAAEVRALGLRGMDAPRRIAVAEDWSDPPVARRAAEPAQRAVPVPPPATWPDRRGRNEPRFDGPVPR